MVRYRFRQLLWLAAAGGVGWALFQWAASLSDDVDQLLRYSPTTTTAPPPPATFDPVAVAAAVAGSPVVPATGSVP